ncbi:hypothetical protein [Sphingobacterium sp.]|uniref:hypothetical protein n=1 Tax=Sphingobacterium sp. TaxID=341027 RepID=UPI00289CC6D1|nr:hypothetical protein [Sphingobacterium sp.]
MGLLFATAMNDWPAQNQFDSNEFVQELRFYFGTKITKDVILKKAKSLSHEDAWRKESASSLLELLDLAETQYQEKNIEQLIGVIIEHYKESPIIADSINRKFISVYH